MLALRNTISFHAWKFMMGVVLLVFAVVLAIAFVMEWSTGYPLNPAAVGMFVTLTLAAAIFFRNSMLPRAGTWFVWYLAPTPQPHGRREWQFARNRMKGLDVALMASAITTIGLLAAATLPPPTEWMPFLFVVSNCILYLSGVLMYAVQFMPDKPWVDATVIVVGALIGFATTIIVGLQPI